jgi:hypothetical protein
VVDTGKDNNDPRNNDLDPNGGDDDLGGEKCDGVPENDHNRPGCGQSSRALAVRGLFKVG